MTAYLDEYNPNSQYANFRVQSDPRKLSYNNIQSCIAVALWPSQNRELVGVHLTTAITNNEELKRVTAELNQKKGRAQCDAYLVGAYSANKYDTETRLKRQLKQIVRTVWVCDVPKVGGIDGRNKAANIDVKIELVNGLPKAYVRFHAEFKTDASGARIPVPKPQGDWPPGQPRNELDKDGKPWMAVDFKRG